jgi:hypothetical protein
MSGIDPKNLESVRSAIRKDLDSVGLIPTGTGIQMVGSTHPPAIMWLYCEGVYVQLFNNRSLEEIGEYLRGPMQLKGNMVNYILRSALHVRVTLEQCGGDSAKATELLMQDKGAERDVVDGMVEACIRTSNEYKIPWDRSFAAQLEESRSGGISFLGCAILLGIAGLLIWGLKSCVF